MSVSPAVESLPLAELLIQVEGQGFHVKCDHQECSIIMEHDGPSRRLTPEALELMRRHREAYRVLLIAGEAPVVVGGQGRSDEDVRADARAVGFVLGLAAVVLGLTLGCWCLATGRWPWELLS